MSEAIVTWQQAEDALTAALEYLGALPDKERAFLAAGSCSSWPQVIRDRQTDYPEEAREPSARLSQRQVRLLEAMLTGERALADVIP